MGDACSTAAGGLFLFGDDTEAPVVGKWVSARGVVHSVGVEAVCWHSGDITRFSKRRRVDGSWEYVTDVNGQILTARLNPDGDLCWSDGDVWKRDSRPPETKTYAAINSVVSRVNTSVSQGTAAMTTILQMAVPASQAESPDSETKTLPAFGKDSESPYVGGEVPLGHSSALEGRTMSNKMSNTPSTFEGRTPILLSELPSRTTTDGTPRRFSRHHGEGDASRKSAYTPATDVGYLSSAGMSPEASPHGSPAALFETTPAARFQDR